MGTPVTISVVNFGAAQGTSAVQFNGATTGNVVVTVGSVVSNGLSSSRQSSQSEIVLLFVLGQ